jgi:hypothetical protein
MSEDNPAKHVAYTVDVLEVVSQSGAQIKQFEGEKTVQAIIEHLKVQRGTFAVRIGKKTL